MDIDQHAAVESRPEPGALDLPGLEYRVAIGEDDRGTPLPDVLDGIKRACIKPIGKRIIDKPAGIARLQAVEPLASIATQRLVAGDTLGEQHPLIRLTCWTRST